MPISYIKHADIDKEKWDKCINNAPNRIIYAYSFYLDSVSRNWDALILDDYEMVMPLIWKRKYGFSYLYQPFFTGGLGVFGNITTVIVNNFLNSIPNHFKYIDINFKENSINPEKVTLQYLQLKKRNNLLLELNKKYEQINKNYKRLAQRMLKKARRNNVEIIRNCEPSEVINFYKKNYEAVHKDITSNDYQRLIVATSIAFKRGNAATYLANKTGEIIAAYLVLRDDKFIYSLIGGSNRKGKDNGAFYLLTDAAIKDHAESKRVFRFEGSDKKGIALFNGQFNPASLHYFNLRLNRLPWPVRLFK